MKRFIIVLLPILVIAGCKKNDIFTINGSINDPAHKIIYLSKVDINTPVVIDSAKITGKGNFRLKVKVSEPDFYQIGYSPSNYANLLAEPGEKIRLHFSRNDLYSEYSVTGSKGSELVKQLDIRLLETKSKLDSLNKEYDKIASQQLSDTRIQELNEQFLETVKSQRRFNIEFILNNINSLASVKALYQRINENMYVLYEPRDLQYLKIVSDSLKVHFPDSKHTKALVSNFEKEMLEFNSRQLKIETDQLPETKLDPDLRDISGKRIRLSSLRGKYVLLSFWSARSRECVADNLQLKEFYKLYNRRGFEIYQINIDVDESVWRSAVKFDELPWINTREDDPANPLNVRLFNVQSVPANYLYDPQGSIIGSNLHGRTLQIKLNQIFQ